MAAPKGNNYSKGRQKGSQNKITKELKDMILGALDDAGGQKYLLEQAINNPSAFLTLVGKCLPKDLHVGGPDGKPLFGSLEEFYKQIRK